MCLTKMYGKLNGFYKRITWGKTSGLILSLIGVFGIMLTLDNYHNYTALLWAMVFWYPTVGAIIAIMGVMDYHPVLKMKLTYWRGAMVGGFMNLVFVLAAYTQLLSMSKDYGLNYSGWSLVICGVIEGVIVGFLMDYFLTKKFGEGPALLERPRPREDASASYDRMEE